MESKKLGVAVLVIAAGFGLWQFGDRGKDAEHRVDAKIDTVQLAADRADISIRVSDDEQTVVREKRRFWFFDRDDAYSVDGGTLKLDGDCGWNCDADFEVTVPKGTKVIGKSGSGDLKLVGVAGVDADARSGDIEVSNVSGDVDLDLTSGDVSVHNLTGRLNVKANSGDIEAAGLRGGAVAVETTSGDMELQLSEANDIRAKGTSGDIEISAPGDGYRVDTRTRSGDIENGFGNDSSGARSLSVETVSGDIELQRN
ncbi:DUF4097 family beta strand repeat protein [Kribbella sandramycini]|uniref:DUF4097 family beta strand repeat protein n=1 Tax=Kribbella sandramycini TaxID=60450 RepID=A0A7Y4P057_9ACTN|nr:DUF4097 family beta strand repeat-containing protein [Kribbella sandramycini]MBB6565299.1 hypothetical protein [Kribbella sandramycini]NOL41568.1 DUF4097 family beta strand repeat protein [Kribbella sandramycini]